MQSTSTSSGYRLAWRACLALLVASTGFAAQASAPQTVTDRIDTLGSENLKLVFGFLAYDFDPSQVAILKGGMAQWRSEQFPVTTK